MKAGSDWNRIERVYHDALALGPAERRALLDQACADDPAVRREVESLLELESSAEPFLERSALQEAATLIDAADALPAPRIPGYTILELIGEGGMGVVYLADQNAPLERRVALKLIRPGMDSRHVVERFQTERQALARMDHPNIAAVFDAGTTSDGRPFFVMEFVPGVPITEYCDRHTLSTRDRLELFLQVCAAVQHAHQKGVIHRDLKPSNVLVASDAEGHARPKVIDFGIAKAVEAPVTGRSGVTEHGTLVGTPEYMSPEQVALSPDVDTTSDVYTLGVLMYELLVGALPFDSKALRDSGHDEMRRVIRESDPPRPSTRLTNGQPDSAGVAAVRRTDVDRLARELRGDLDWVVLKALEKDRRRRYPTVSALAADVERYLANKPVEARPPSATYRIGKFVRRYRGAVAAAAALLVVLVAGLSMTLVQYIRAESARAEAESQRELAKQERAQADTHRQVAEAATSEATLRRNDAERAYEDANAARIEALREAGAAEAARHDAEYRTYVATIAAADGELRAGLHVTARERLLTIPADQREWEWHHLFLRSDPSLATLQSTTPCANTFVNSDTPLRQSQVANAPSRFFWRSLGALVLDEDGARMSFRRCATVESWVAGNSAHRTSSAGQILAVGPNGDLLTPVPTTPGETSWEVQRIHAGSTRLPDRLGPFERQPTCAAVSPDGKRIAVGLLTPLAYAGWPLDDVLEIWDAEGPRRIVRMTPAAPRLPDTRVPSACLVTFSPDSSLVATSGAAVRIWRADTGVEVAADGIQAGKVSQPIAFSPNGMQLAIGRATGQVDILHLGSAPRVEPLDTTGFFRVSLPPRDADRSIFIGSRRRNEVLAVAFSPDGTRIVSGTDVNVGIWDVPQGVLTTVLPGHAAPVVAVAIARNGDVVTGDGTGLVKVWPHDLATARITLPGSFSPRGGGLAVSADGSVATLSQGDGTLSTWRLADGANAKEVVLRRGSGKSEPQLRLIASQVLTNDGRHVVTGEPDGTVRIQRTSDGVAAGTRPLEPMLEPGCERSNLGLQSDGRFYAPVFDMALSPDETVVALMHGNCLVVRDLRTQKDVAILHELPTGFVFRPDGTLLVASYPERTRLTPAQLAARPDSTTIRIWDWRTNTTRKALPARAMNTNDRYWRVALSADGRRAALGTASTVFVWDGDLEKQIGRIPAGFNTNSVALTADGRRIATIGPNTVRVWDTDRLQLLLTITDDDLSVDLAFTRDGRLVAARSTGGLTVWNTQKPAVQTPLPPRVQHLRDPIRNIGPMRDQH